MDLLRFVLNFVGDEKNRDRWALLVRCCCCPSLLDGAAAYAGVAVDVTVASTASAATGCCVGLLLFSPEKQATRVLLSLQKKKKARLEREGETERRAAKDGC